MGILFLIRHAQASFLEQNYDKLSTLGEAQAGLLGEYLARRNIIFDRVCTGPCVRQNETVELMSDGYRKAGLGFPEPVVLPEFNEYQGEAVLERSLPGLLENDPSIRDLRAAFQASTGSGERRATFKNCSRPPSGGGWMGRSLCQAWKRGLNLVHE